MASLCAARHQYRPVVAKKGRLTVPRTDSTRLAEVVAQATTAAADGRTVDDLVNNAEINKEYEITASLERLMTGFHRWNLKAAYKEVQQFPHGLPTSRNEVPDASLSDPAHDSSFSPPLRGSIPIGPCSGHRPNSSSPMDGCVRIVQTRRHLSSPTT